MLVRYGIEIVAEFICENCTLVSLGIQYRYSVAVSPLEV